jgi:gliding motility-associated-like protein
MRKKVMPKITLFIFSALLSFFTKAQTASFTYAGTTPVLCNPATINFTQTCTGNPIGFTWIFDNGQTSNAPNPSISFATAGSYNVKLIAVFNFGVLETSQTITINQSNVTSLSADRSYICTPGNINFTTVGNGNIVSYEWTFGDGTNTSSTTPNIAHAYASFGSYTATVKATDLGGCFATSSINIIVQNPPINASVSPTNVCVIAATTFNATVNVPVGGSVTNYSWTFGDGSPPANTTLNTSLHNYIDSGTYLPTLNITTNEGCTNSYNYPAIAFGIPPIDQIAYPKKLVYCGSETPVFVGKAKYANTYSWDYGDGFMETVSDTITRHKYNRLGLKTISVTPYFNGCAGTPITFQIDVVGVIASFRYTNTCIDKKTFAFTNTSQGNQSAIIWNFGDGSANVFTTNPIHTYPTNGAFNTLLTTVDDITGCRDSIASTIYTASPSLINPDLFVCRNSNTTFTIQNNYTNTGISYKWNVIGLPEINNSSNPYTPVATAFGTYTNNYVIINNGIQYCGDTLLLDHPISVRGPNLGFNYSADVCAKNADTITNTSIPYLATDTVNLWYWNLGITPKNDTIYQPPILFYPGAGVYTVKLFAVDKNGCMDSLIRPVRVKPTPFLRLFPRTDTLCQGNTESLFAFHSDTLLWNPATFLSCTNCDTVIANPNTNTIFYATATNSLGCNIKDSIIMTVVEPFTAMAVRTPIYICAQDTVQINVSPPNKRIVWSPSLGLSDTTIYNPIVSGITSTTYVAMLEDSIGCFTNSASVDVIVKTLPLVNAGQDRVLQYASPFTITPVYSSNIVSYEWSPSANINCNNCTSPSGTAFQTEKFNIKVTSDSGCVASDDITVFVECKYANLLIPTAFSPNRDGKNDILHPITRGIKSITKFTIFNRYGQILYEAKNKKPNEKTTGWDGKFKGIDQEGGVYVFLLEAICDLGETIIKKDSFILLR